jgi:hypothetical protein
MQVSLAGAWKGVDVEGELEGILRRECYDKDKHGKRRKRTGKAWSSSGELSIKKSKRGCHGAASNHHPTKY